MTPIKTVHFGAKCTVNLPDGHGLKYPTVCILLLFSSLSRYPLVYIYLDFATQDYLVTGGEKKKIAAITAQ